MHAAGQARAIGLTLTGGTRIATVEILEWHTGQIHNGNSELVTLTHASKEQNVNMCASAREKFFQHVRKPSKITEINLFETIATPRER